MAERVVEDVLAAFASLSQPASRAYYDKKRREGKHHVAVGGNCQLKRQFRMLLTWARSSVVHLGGRAEHLRRTARDDHHEWNQCQPHQPALCRNEARSVPRADCAAAGVTRHPLAPQGRGAWSHSAMMS